MNPKRPIKLAHPILAPIKSSMASHAGYDPAKQELVVRFHNGNTYTYPDVAPNIGHTLTGAQSFGEAFNRHIVGNRIGRKL